MYIFYILYNIYTMHAGLCALGELIVMVVTLMLCGAWFGTDYGTGFMDVVVVVVVEYL